MLRLKDQVRSRASRLVAHCIALVPLRSETALLYRTTRTTTLFFLWAAKKEAAQAEKHRLCSVSACFRFFPSFLAKLCSFMESIDFGSTSGSSQQPTTPRDSELACPDEVRAKHGLSWLSSIQKSFRPSLSVADSTTH